MAPRIEAVLRQGLARAKTPSEKSAWFTTFRNVVLTPGGLAWLERVWRREEKVQGLTFSETDEIAMAMELAVRDVPESRAIVSAQLARIINPDRKARFEFVMPSLSADPEVRAEAFERLRDVANRRHEAWALESLRYLCHPLRERQARGFLRASLELLPEIQRTGDIFFPKRWADAVMSGQQSKDAAAIVRDFLRREAKLPERLRWIVLSSADDLYRAAQSDHAPN